MNSCKNFSKKYPAILAVMAFFFLWGLLKLMNFMPEGPLSFAINECVMAVVVFAVTFLFMGKEKVTFSTKGFGYAFSLLRGYYIFMVIVLTLGVLNVILENVVLHKGSSYQLIPFINISIAALFVGIVEEFIFRGLIFGGLLQKFGSNKKTIIIAAFISGISFGVLHVIGYVLGGEITNTTAAATAILKIVQCGIFGIVLCFIYYKTRNIYVVAALHSLDDFLLLVAGGAAETGAGDYVTNDSGQMGMAVGAYVVFTLILVPAVVKSIKEITVGEAVPFDDDFLPRKVEFVKKSKKKK